MYDFEAGDLSLDFANTQDWHSSQKPVENLNSYADLFAWGERAGLVAPELKDRLARKADERPEETGQEYHFALQVRDAIWRIFTCRSTGETIRDEDLALLNHVVSQAMAHLRLTPMGGEVCWNWADEVDGANLILWPVARAAAELLTSSEASNVHQCEDDRGCGYLFIDQTKNHSRRWCSMDSCGNRAKARRHYSRIQAN